jgi:hypothetical protein
MDKTQAPSGLAPKADDLAATLAPAGGELY